MVSYCDDELRLAKSFRFMALVSRCLVAVPCVQPSINDLNRCSYLKSVHFRSSPTRLFFGFCFPYPLGIIDYRTGRISPIESYPPTTQRLILSQTQFSLVSPSFPSTFQLPNPNRTVRAFCWLGCSGGRTTSSGSTWCCRSAMVRTRTNSR